MLSYPPGESGLGPQTLPGKFDASIRISTCSLSAPTASVHHETEGGPPSGSPPSWLVATWLCRVGGRHVLAGFERRGEPLAARFADHRLGLVVAARLVGRGAAVRFRAAPAL